MRALAGSPADPKIRILRPLLDFRKNELQTFVEAQNISFREDSSNAQLDAERNRVRHNVIPVLREQFGPEFETVLLQKICLAW